MALQIEILLEELLVVCNRDPNPNPNPLRLKHNKNRFYHSKEFLSLVKYSMYIN